MNEELEKWLLESIDQARIAQSETGRFKDFYAGHIQAFTQVLEWLRLTNGENE